MCFLNGLLRIQWAESRGRLESLRNQGTKCLGETLLAAAMRGRREESSCPIRGRGRLPHEIANRTFSLCFFPHASQRTDLCTVHCLCAYSFDDECTGSDRDGGSPQSRSAHSSGSILPACILQVPQYEQAARHRSEIHLWACSHYPVSLLWRQLRQIIPKPASPS